jgi:hypothetical protein
MLRQLFMLVGGDGETRRIYHGIGTPEGALSAGIGSLYMRADGGSGTSVYIKESGTGATGWTALDLSATPDELTAGTPCVQNPHSANSTTDQAHGLGAVPTFVVSYLECLSAELGYSEGDRIDISQYNTPHSVGVWIAWDATNCTILSYNASLLILRRDTRAEGVGTSSKWKIVVQPYLIS